MTYHILVAEDLEDNRIYLEALLAGKGHTVTVAENGKVALDLFNNGEFDMVMTDLRMPEMDGITLLRHIKKNKPETPVVIISAYRELESVIEALRTGACDYITKPYEEQDVFASIERISRISEPEVLEKIGASYLEKEVRILKFDNDPDHISHVAQYLCRHLSLLALNAEMQSIQVALIEALNNAVFHGNLALSSEIKQLEDIASFGTYREMARERRKQAPYNTRFVTIEYSLDSDRVQYRIKDEGEGFDFNRQPNPKDPESFLKPSGRGLLMIRTFCDEVSWNDTGNEITLVKYHRLPAV